MVYGFSCGLPPQLAPVVIAERHRRIVYCLQACGVAASVLLLWCSCLLVICLQCSYIAGCSSLYIKYSSLAEILNCLCSSLIYVSGYT